MMSTGESKDIYCNMDIDSGGWTVIRKKVLLFLKVFYCLKLTVKIIIETSAEMCVSLLINVYHHTSSGNSEKERWLSKL